MWHRLDACVPVIAWEPINISEMPRHVAETMASVSGTDWTHWSGLLIWNACYHSGEYKDGDFYELGVYTYVDHSIIFVWSILVYGFLITLYSQTLSGWSIVPPIQTVFIVT